MVPVGNGSDGVLWYLLLQLQHGADGSVTDSEGRKPYEVLPESKCGQLASHNLTPKVFPWCGGAGEGGSEGETKLTQCTRHG